MNKIESIYEVVAEQPHAMIVKPVMIWNMLDYIEKK